jgi:ribonuclease Y
MSFTLTFVLGAAVFLLGIVGGYYFRKAVVRKRADTIEARLNERIERVKEEAREILLDAKRKATELFAKTEDDLRREREKLSKLEAHLLKKDELLEGKRVEIERSQNALREEMQKAEAIRKEAEALRDSEIAKLEAISGLSKEAAKQELFSRVEDVYREDLRDTLQKMDRERREAIERKAVEIISTVLQRYARSHVGDLTTSVVHLPSEEIKGRIIGREGRNIRHFERLTGVELIMDEAPDAITISSFDPVRREIAKIALERLIQDGRIQPARIEEKIEEAKKEINQKIREAGEAAVYEVGILDLPQEIVQLLGRLAFRTSYGQNVLVHSVEVAILAGMLAEELGLRTEVAKKAGLLHDIGKAVDHEIEGTHLELGRKILQKYKISDEVVKAMQSHHEDYPVEIPEAYVVNAADAISGARPGARRDTLEHYLKRLADLERIANEFPGVEKSYAIQAGRELRVFVRPEHVDDVGALQLARNIADKIESELKYPGEIKVTVIRETRAVEYAK